MTKLDNAISLAFKKAVEEKHTKKKSLVADLLLHKKQSNTIKLPEKTDESKKTISNERVGKGDNDNGLVGRSKSTSL